MPAPAIQSADTKVLWLLLFAVGAATTLVLKYNRSAAARARKEVRGVAARFEAAVAGVPRIADEVKKDVQEAARSYTNEIRRRYLSDITLDEVRNVAPGVRLQPLYAAGVTRLIQCHDWSANRFLQLRGIGPDSAKRIRMACEILTRAAYDRPIPFPSASNMNAEAFGLYGKLFIYKSVVNLITGQEDALRGALSPIKERVAFVESRTGFFRWLVGSESRGEIREGIDEADALVARASAGQDLGLVVSAAEERLRAARAVIHQSIAAEVLGSDVASNAEFYRRSVRNVLGLTSDESRAESRSPQRTPALSEEPPPTIPVSISRATAGDGGYTIPPPAQCHIALKTSGEPPRLARGQGVPTSDIWLPANAMCEVAGYKLAGMLYVGNGLFSVNGQMVEPALIDPSLPVDHSAANCHERALSYWSSYSYADPVGRASYLAWLARGRDDPQADIGYVFLYFYGLERRLLADATLDPEASGDSTAIIAEVRRLRSIYTNGSFQRYTQDFLDFAESSAAIHTPSDGDDPCRLSRGHMSFQLRRSLGSLALEGKPLPAKLAYAWFHNDPRSRFPTVANRCPEQVAALFAAEYHKRHGAGIVLPANKTRLKLTYRPASASFGGQLVKTVDLPDVSVLSTAYSKLVVIADDCFRQLDGYSRYIARNPERGPEFDAFVLLPPAIWPAVVTDALNEIWKGHVAPGPARLMKLEDLLRLLPNGYASTRGRFGALCEALQKNGLGIEPDTRLGNVLPEPADPVALFKIDAKDAVTSAGFGVAALLVQLSSVIAAAGGDFSDLEAERLRQEIEDYQGITEYEKSRLLARVMVYKEKPPTLSGLKRMIAPLGARERGPLVDFLFAMLHADGVVAPEEVKVMERIYTLFGLDTALLYTRLHGLTASGEPNSPTPQRSGTVQIDREKVERLKRDSAEITKRLTVIFDSGEEAGIPIVPPPEPSEAGALLKSQTLLGLESSLASLLTIVLERSQWTRAEFEELCSEKGLMPDGAIENINDAAFTKYDKPIIEGDDPLEVDRQLIEESVL